MDNIIRVNINWLDYIQYFDVIMKHFDSHKIKIKPTA
jgi:hypothetical protein